MFGLNKNNFTQDNAVLLIKGDKFDHDDLIWNDRQGQIWRWQKNLLRKIIDHFY